MNVPAHPIIPPAAPGWWGPWCEKNGLNPYHPETHPELARRAFVKEAARRGHWRWTEPGRFPSRNPYRLDPCCTFHDRLKDGAR